MPHQPSPPETSLHSRRSEPQPASTHPPFSCLTFALPHMLQQVLISVSDAYNYVYLNNTNYLSSITSTPLELSSLLVRATRAQYLSLADILTWSSVSNIILSARARDGGPNFAKFHLYRTAIPFPSSGITIPILSIALARKVYRLLIVSPPSFWINLQSPILPYLPPVIAYILPKIISISRLSISFFSNATLSLHLL